MGSLNSSKKIIIDDNSIYGDFIFRILDCTKHGDKLVIYRESEGNVEFINYEFFLKCKESDSNVEILYISEYIEKGLSGEELDNTIDRIIGDMKEKANIFVKKSDNKLEDILLNYALTYVPEEPFVGEMTSDEAFAAQKEAGRVGHATITSDVNAIIRMVEKYNR